MHNAREVLQTFSRRFGLLNKHCCTACDCKVSMVQSHILDEVYRRNHPSMQQVSDALGMDITTFSRQIQTLVRLKLMIKRQDPDDRRVYLLQLTAEGEAVAAQIDRQVNEQLAEVFEQMSDFEREVVLRSLNMLNETMARSKPCC